MYLQQVENGTYVGVGCPRNILCARTVLDSKDTLRNHLTGVRACNHNLSEKSV